MAAGDFPLGRVVATPGALATVPAEELQRALSRHATRDWGEVGTEDAEANNTALRDGNRLLSAYLTTASCQRFWIITEADRSATTVLLPDEY